MRKLITATALAMLLAVPTAATADEEAITVDVHAEFNDWGDCTFIEFSHTGPVESYLLYQEGQLWASGPPSSAYRLLGTLYGVPGEPAEVSTSGGYGPLSPGTYTLVAVGRFTTGQASVECGDIEFEAALNGWYDDEEPAEDPPGLDEQDIDEPPVVTQPAPRVTKPAPETDRSEFWPRRVRMGHLPRAI